MNTLLRYLRSISPYILGFVLILVAIEDVVTHRVDPNFPGFLFDALACFTIGVFSLGVNFPIAKRYLPLWYTIVMLPAVAAVFSVAQILYWNSHPEAHQGTVMAYVLTAIGFGTSSILMYMMLRVRRFIILVEENQGRTLTEEERFEILKGLLEMYPLGTTVLFRDDNGKVIPPSTVTSTNRDD